MTVLAETDTMAAAVNPSFATLPAATSSETSFKTLHVVRQWLFELAQPPMIWQSTAQLLSCAGQIGGLSAEYQVHPLSTDDLPRLHLDRACWTQSMASRRTGMAPPGWR